jgi:hypothetical protein
MARATIIIDDGGAPYTFAVSPEFAPQITVLRSQKGIRLGEREVWPVKGKLLAAGTVAVVAAFDALKLKIETEEVTCSWKKDGATQRTLTTAASELGPQFSGLNIVPTQANWATGLQYNFEIIAERWDVGAGVIENQYTVAYQTAQNGQLIQAKSGQVRTTSGSSAKAAAEASTPSVLSGYKLMSESVVPDENDTMAQYSFQMIKLFADLPSGIRIAKRRVRAFKKGRRIIVTGNATFIAESTLEQANQAAQDFIDRYVDAYEAGEHERTIDEGEDENSAVATFMFETVDLDKSQKLIEFYRTIQLSGGLNMRTFKPVEGSTGFIFKGAESQLVLVDSGYFRWKGYDFPDPPILKLPGFVRVQRGMAPSSTKHPDPAAFDKGIVPVRWSHVYWSTDSSAADNLDWSILLTGAEFPSG